MRVVSRRSPTLLNEMCRRIPDRGRHRGGEPLGREALRAQQTAPSSVLQAPLRAGQSRHPGQLIHIAVSCPAGMSYPRACWSHETTSPAGRPPAPAGVPGFGRAASAGQVRSGRRLRRRHPGSTPTGKHDDGCRGRCQAFLALAAGSPAARAPELRSAAKTLAQRAPRRGPGVHGGRHLSPLPRAGNGEFRGRRGGPARNHHRPRGRPAEQFRTGGKHTGSGGCGGRRRGDRHGAAWTLPCFTMPALGRQGRGRVRQSAAVRPGPAPVHPVPAGRRTLAGGGSHDG
jgi:hypothetical protein